MFRPLFLSFACVLPVAAQLQPSYDLALPAGSSAASVDFMGIGAAGDCMAGYLGSADVNGDGVEDLIAGTSVAPADRLYAGQVNIWFGSELAGGSRPPAAPADVTIIGGAAGEALSASGMVRAVDVNGDGIKDLLIGAQFGKGPSGTGITMAGNVYIVFGRRHPQVFPSVIDLERLNNGSTITDGADVLIHGGAQNASNSSLGTGLWMETGDLNNDGVEDLVVTTSGYFSGRAYIIFGRKSPSAFPPVIDLQKLNSPTVKDGADVRLASSFSDGASSLGSPKAIRTGDIDGDGLTDLLLGDSPGAGPDRAKPFSGMFYVIRGRTTFPSTINLATQNGAGVTNGTDCTIYGADTGDAYSSRWIIWSSMSLADINGDGRADLLLGFPHADGPGETRDAAGEMAVIYGKSSLSPVVDLAGGAGADVLIQGPAASRYIGSCFGVGDINGDGVKDLFFGDSYSDGPDGSRTDAGAIHVILGRAGAVPFAPVIDLALKNGAGVVTGSDFVIHGASAKDEIPGIWSLQAKDLSGDGIDDLIFTAPYGKGPGEERDAAGEVLAIFGKASFPPLLDLAAPESPADLWVYGKSGDRLGFYESIGTGDINGDGQADLLMGAYAAERGGATFAGSACVILGGPGGRSRPVPAFLAAPGSPKRLSHQGTPGLRYEFQRSTDMVEWTTIDEAVASPEGVVNFSDDEAPEGSAFYRIHRP